MDIQTIREKNLSIKYPKPIINKAWDNPGKYLGIDDKYKYPDWNCLKEGYSLPKMNITDYSPFQFEFGRDREACSI